MTINPPKCALNMEQRLAALRRDQEIDGLRVYLIKYNLFPRNRDPHNSPIRLEELKELVKHWKLHRQRGFWRDHPDKDDLVRALLQHIKCEATNKQRRQEAQDRRSQILNGGDDGSPGKLRDLTTFFSGGNAVANSTDQIDDRDREQAVVVAEKKKFGGDLFYQRGDYDEGMIYLSRIDRSRFQSEGHDASKELLTTSASSPTTLTYSLSESHEANSKPNGVGNTAACNQEDKSETNQGLSVLTDPLPFCAVNMTAQLTKEMKHKSVEGLYSISCHKGFEAQLLREGALATLLSVLKQDDPSIRLYAAATILNLTHSVPTSNLSVPTLLKKVKNESTVSSSIAMMTSLATRGLYAKMVDESVLAALLDLAHTPHPTVKALCARALLRLTSDEAHHFLMVHEGVVPALLQIMATVTTTMPSPLAAPNDVKLLCVLALVNLSSVPRAVTCDVLLSEIVLLTKNGDAETRLLCAQALLNLSILPTTRGAVVDEGAIGGLEMLTAVALKPLQLTLLGMITCTLCNFAAVKTNQDALTKNSALNILSMILTNIETELFVEIPAKDEERVSRTDLLTIQKNCVNCIAMLCCNAKIQTRIRNAGLIPKLMNILRRDNHEDIHEELSKDSGSISRSGGYLDSETKKFVVVALANLALDDRCRPTLVQDGAASLFLDLLNASDSSVTVGIQEWEGVAGDNRTTAALLLKLDCVTALSNLLLHPANFQALVDAGVVPAFLDLIRNEKLAASHSSREIQKACVHAMLGLIKDPGMKSRLAEATSKRLDGKDTTDRIGAIPTMLAFAARNVDNAELCGCCISFLRHLSTRAVNYEPLYHEGAVTLLVRVLRRPSSAEAPATIYALWSNCLATLVHLASHESRRISLLHDGVLEAIQHFLTASAADQRQRDTLTNRCIIKAQYAASQIIYKVHDIWAGSDALPVAEHTSREPPPFIACLLLLATQSASQSSQVSKSKIALQLQTARLTTLTIAKVALAVPLGPKLLAQHADIAPALNMIMRTGIDEVQVCAAAALCNLAAEWPMAANGVRVPRIWRDATVDDFIVITLLRVNNHPTKDICAMALFNLLTHEGARDQFMKDGVFYALLKLARLESKSVQTLALRALYNMSLDPKQTTQLLEMELVRTLAKMYQAEWTKPMKLLMIGILSNLSSASYVSSNMIENSEGEGVELRMLQEGILSVLKKFARMREPEIKVYVANVLYNLSCAASPRVAEILVYDESNVFGMLVVELKSESRDVRKYAAKTLANLSASLIAVQVMTNDGTSTIISAINETIKRGMSKSTATDSHFLCVETNCACVHALRNLFWFESNQHQFIACNGLSTFAALLTNPVMAIETTTLRLATDMVCSLAKLRPESASVGARSYQELLVRDGVVRALVAIAKGAMDGSTTRAEENAACMNIVTPLSSLSVNPRCHDAMLRDGALAALTMVCVTNVANTKAPFKDLVDVRGEAFAFHCMVLIRNLSRQEPLLSSTTEVTLADAASEKASSHSKAVRSQRLTSQSTLVPIVLSFSQSIDPQTREHVIVSLYNLAQLRHSKRELIKHDAVKVLLRLGLNAATPFKRHVCSLALQALAIQSPSSDLAQTSSSSDSTVDTAKTITIVSQWGEPYVDKVVQEGIVTAIAALADSHQPEVLVTLSANLYTLATPPPAVNESISLLWTSNRAIEQSGEPADWTKVLITDLASCTEIDGSSNSTITAAQADRKVSLEAPLPSGLHEFDYCEDFDSDASEGEHCRSKEPPSGKLRSPTLSQSLKKHPQRLKLAAPRTCSTDTMLGCFQLFSDPKPGKVQVNVDEELAKSCVVGSTILNGTLMASKSCQDELPRLRFEEKAIEEPSKPDRKVNGRKQSTLSQARQDATSSEVSTTHGLLSNNRSNTPNSPHKSPVSTAKRRSHQLEPLSTSF